MEIEYCISRPNEIQQDAEGKEVGDAISDNQVPCKESDKDAGSIPVRRLQRTAANKAREKVRSWSRDGQV